MKVWETGAFSDGGKTDVAELNVHMLSYEGLQMFAMNQFIKVGK
jgi:hypothetical protein